MLDRGDRLERVLGDSPGFAEQCLHPGTQLLVLALHDGVDALAESVARTGDVRQAMVDVDHVIALRCDFLLVPCILHVLLLIRSEPPRVPPALGA